MGLSANLSNLAARVATECKALRTMLNGNGGDLSGLATSAKANLVAAINELHAALALAGGGGISDTASSSTTTWSSQKIAAEIQAAKDQLVNGSSASLDTFGEVAAALGEDGNLAANLTNALARRIRFDAPQVLNADEQAQARSNIDAAPAQAVGDTTINFTTVFENGLNT